MVSNSVCEYYFAYFEELEGEKQSFSKSLGLVLSNWRAANRPRKIPQRIEPAENTADMIKMVFSLMAPPLWEMKRQLKTKREKNMLARIS